MVVQMRPHPVPSNGQMLCKTAGVRIARRSIGDLWVDDIRDSLAADEPSTVTVRSVFLCSVAAVGTLESHPRPAILRLYRSMPP